MDKDTFYSVLTQMKYSETRPRLRLCSTWGGAKACGRQRANSQLLYCWLNHQTKAVGATSALRDIKYYWSKHHIWHLWTFWCFFFFVCQFINNHCCAVDGWNKSLLACEHIASTLWLSLQKTHSVCQWLHAASLSMSSQLSCYSGGPVTERSKGQISDLWSAAAAALELESPIIGSDRWSSLPPLYEHTP